MSCCSCLLRNNCALRCCLPVGLMHLNNGPVLQHYAQTCYTTPDADKHLWCENLRSLAYHIEDSFTHLIGRYTDNTCRPSLFSQLSFLNLSLAFPGAGPGALLLFAFAGWWTFLIAIVASSRDGFWLRAVRHLLRLRCFLRVSCIGTPGGWCQVWVIVGPPKCGGWGRPGHRVGWDTIHRRGAATIRIAVVVQLGSWCRAARLTFITVGPQGSRACSTASAHACGCCYVPKHFCSHLLTFCLPLLEKVRCCIWSEPASCHVSFCRCAVLSSLHLTYTCKPRHLLNNCSFRLNAGKPIPGNHTAFLPSRLVGVGLGIKQTRYTLMRF